MNITLTLNVNEVNGILAALSQMPYGQVADLIVKIREQAMPQATPAEAAAGTD